MHASGAAQRVRVLGGRNVYQCTNIELVPDWPRAWDAVTFESVCSWTSFTTKRVTRRQGKLFTALDNDPDHLIGALRARVYAEQMTVRMFVEFLGTIEYSRAAADFVDTRLYHGRSRMDMPVFIYLREIVYRAFALPTLANRTTGDGRVIDPFVLINADGISVPLESLCICARQLVRVIPVPNTGEMVNAVGEDPVEGNGMCIAQGCRIDGFANANPETFDLAQWKQMANFFQPINFHSDDSGMGVPFILLDEPVFVPTELFVPMPFGLAGAKEKIIVMRSPFNGCFRLDVPNVRATLIFEAELFSRVFPRDGADVLRDVVVNVSQLNAEYCLLQDNTWTEVPYANGQLSGDKAWEQARPLLDRPYFFAEGGYGARVQRDTAHKRNRSREHRVQ